jgi:RNA polymerase sigma-32 factor
MTEKGKKNRVIRKGDKDGPKLPAVTRPGPKLPAKPRKPAPPRARSTFEQYIAEITRVPLLTREEELELATRYAENRDPESAKALVEANLRFVVKMAYSYRNYNVRLTDLVQEGNIGLMKAVEKFKPERGYRLISYAVWWIKAYMQNYIIRSWSMVKVGTTQMQRKLFFRSRGEDENHEMGAVEETLQEEVPSTDGTLLVPAESRKKSARRQLSAAARDFSLDMEIGDDSNQTYVDLLPSPEPAQEEKLAKEEIMAQVAYRLEDFITDLPEKELFILQNRLLSDEPRTLQDIGEIYGVSRERIRQIENSLKERIRKALQSIDGVADIVD